MVNHIITNLTLAFSGSWPFPIVQRSPWINLNKIRKFRFSSKSILGGGISLILVIYQRYFYKIILAFKCLPTWRPNMWSPWRWVMKIFVILPGLMLLFCIWICDPSPQSKIHTAPSSSQKNHLKIFAKNIPYLPNCKAVQETPLTGVG